MNKLIEKYNQPNNLIFISSYPEKNTRYSQKVCAVGGFTKNTVEALAKLEKNRKFIIISTEIGKKTNFYQDDQRTLVTRLIQRNNPLSFFKVMKFINKLNQVKFLIVEFEFGSFGGVLSTAFIALVMLFTRIKGKKIVTVIHQVIDNTQAITTHLGWQKDDLRIPFYNFFIKHFYQVLVFLSHKIIVTEEIFRKKLVRITGNSQKINYIAHGVDVDNITIFEKNQARKKLGLPKDKKIILGFGYLSWYKGLDLLVQFAKKARKNKKYIFLIAGGASFTNKNKSHYQGYFDSFKKLSKNCLVTGFVPEEKIGLYFSAADLVVFPYRVMMSSSGPLSLAYSLDKPVLLSKNLQPYLLSDDFRNNLSKSNLKKDDLFFNLQYNDFMAKVKGANLSKLAVFSSNMKKQRNYNYLAKEYAKVLTTLAIQPSLAKKLSLSF